MWQAVQVLKRLSLSPKHKERKTSYTKVSVTLTKICPVNIGISLQSMLYAQ